MLFIPYSTYTNYLKWLALLLLADVRVVSFVHVPWGAVLNATLLPRMHKLHFWRGGNRARRADRRTIRSCDRGPIFFLAFSPIFPASASLIEKHEKQNKEKAGLDRTTRSRAAAGIDSGGAAMGCIGLAAFATTVWNIATGVWVAVAISAWLARGKGSSSPRRQHPVCSEQKKRCMIMHHYKCG